jgi:hypothetical protein
MFRNRQRPDLFAPCTPQYDWLDEEIWLISALTSGNFTCRVTEMEVSAIRDTVVAERRISSSDWEQSCRYALGNSYDKAIPIVICNVHIALKMEKTAQRGLTSVPGSDRKS